MNFDVQSLAQTAQRALFYEVTLHPKPGLVDAVDNGAHQDMDIFTFIDSSISLLPYFQHASTLGFEFNGDNLQDLFSKLRILGKMAEETMFAATKQVNTHKGAIFSLGIALGATSYCCQQQSYNLATVQQIIQSMLCDLVETDFANLADKNDLTAGEKQFLQYGTLGIRGQAQAGFPLVIDQAVPYLREQTGDLTSRLLNTLMYIMQFNQDTNLIKRAQNPAILDWVQEQCRHYFALGGANTSRGLKFLHTLNQRFIDRNLSSGGCADLLILTIYFGLLEGII